MVKSHKFGELNIAFTDQFEERWTDEGSNADDKVSFWHPIPPEGFHALGSLVRDDRKTPEGRTASIVVQIANPDNIPKKGPALAKPLRYENVWKDIGSDADMDGSCWKPIPPEGYVALGHLFLRGHGSPNKDERDSMVCVREDLTVEGEVAKAIWNDDDSGADDDFAAWSPVLTDGFSEKDMIALDPNTFIGTSGDDAYDKPDSIRRLKLKLRRNMQTELPQPPKLESFAMPTEEQQQIVDQSIILPFTAIYTVDKFADDRERDSKWQMEHSPFYTLERLVNYQLLMFASNGSSVEQTRSEAVTIGWEESATKEFSVTTGLSIASTVGVSGGLPIGASVETSLTMTVSFELGFTNSFTRSRSKSTEITQTLNTGPKSATAMWVTTYQLRLKRGDGTIVGKPLTLPFGTESFYVSEYKFPE